VSFFDDEPDDEPTRVTRPARPRRAASASAGAGGARPRGGGGGGGRAGGAGAPPSDIARRRQFVLFGGLAVVAILLILTVKSCAGTRAKNALKDYNRNVTSIVQSSDGEVSKQLFDVLGGTGDQKDVQVAVQQVRLEAEQDAKRAKGLSAPSAVGSAQHDLELVMNFRLAGVTEIAEQLNKAVSSQPGAQDAIRRIAGQMQQFLASDVVYSQRVKPLIEDALKDKDINDQQVPASKFLPSIGWLDPDQVSTKLNPSASSDSSTGRGTPKPGTHGHGLLSTKIGATTLQPGSAINKVTAATPLPVEVSYANQGENDETNVTINVTITGGPRRISVDKRLNQTKAGTQGAVTINVPTVPPRGTSTVMKVTIKPVNGEINTTNNTSSYTVLFQ
jgi:hypothetical protein